MVAQIHDGHGRIFDAKTRSNIRLAIVEFGWVEDQLIVLKSKDKTFEVGDLITTIAELIKAG